MAGEVPQAVQVVDIRAIMEMLRQQANKTTLEVEYENGEPRITLIFTDKPIEETTRLIFTVESMATRLVTQAYEHMGIWKKPTGQEAQNCQHDMNVA